MSRVTIRPVRRLRLSARLAAARLTVALARTRRGGAGARHALALRWRRRRARPLVGPAGGTGRVETTISQRHVHFHTAPTAGHRTEMRDRWRQVMSPVHPPVRIVRELRERTRWTTASAPHPAQVDETPQAQVRQMRPSMERRPAQTRRAPRDLPAQLESTTTPRRRTASAGDRWGRGASPARGGTVRQRRFAAATEWRYMPGEQARRRQVLVDESSSDTRVPPPQRPRRESRRSVVPVHIVWRDASRPERSAPGSVTAAAAAAAAAARTSPSAADADHTIVHAMPWARPRPAAVRFADFEPGLLDRLTEDVIRRVERCVRIERERRGI